MIYDVNRSRRELDQPSEPLTEEGRQDEHHIRPWSRFPEERYKQGNLFLVDVGLHRLYHRVFKNRTPPEIAILLHRYFLLLGSNARGKTIEHLTLLYWWRFQKPSRKDPLRVIVSRSQWDAHVVALPEHEKFVAVFGKSKPHKIIRWVCFLKELIGDRDEHEALRFLSRTFWNNLWFGVSRKPAPKPQKRPIQRFFRPRRSVRRA